MTNTELKKDLTTASKYSIASNVISAGLITAVISERLPESMSDNEKQLSLVIIMAVTTYLANIAIVIYKKKIQPRFNAWINKG